MGGHVDYLVDRRMRIQKEINETGKYPASFQWLPHNVDSGTDNAKILSACKRPYEGGCLTIKPELLGLNKKSLCKNVGIDFGEIYIIHAQGTEFYKIGVSTNFARRFRDLSAASPLVLSIVKYAKCDNPHLLENKLHSLFAKQLVKNEWFQLSYDDLSTCFNAIDKYYNIRGQE